MQNRSDTRSSLDRLERLMPELYGDLRRLASAQLNGERADHTLQTTALVHEAYLKLAEQTTVSWDDEKKLLQASVVIMRRILVDYARARNSQKRKASGARVPLGQLTDGDQASQELIALDLALDELKELDERQAQIVELRYFGGMTLQEVADHYEISLASVKREWAMAKAWLYRRVHLPS